jgi:hypothetical protein
MMPIAGMTVKNETGNFDKVAASWALISLEVTETQIKI